ncbi:hypothetical protein [Pseudarthrobacter sp. NIBRBAC000502770]|uniref:hypothetical protein n=1 Tax=Pseudarthrobacter sp. NIBRBAC000502770 TaxID=2590785 RepID=UPI001AEFB192
MNQQLIAAVEPKDDEFKQAARGIESEPQLPGRAVLVEIRNVHRVICRVDPILRTDAVFKSG